MLRVLQYLYPHYPVSLVHPEPHTKQLILNNSECWTKPRDLFHLPSGSHQSVGHLEYNGVAVDWSRQPCEPEFKCPWLCSEHNE